MAVVGGRSRQSSGEATGRMVAAAGAGNMKGRRVIGGMETGSSRVAGTAGIEATTGAEIGRVIEAGTGAENERGIRAGTEAENGAGAMTGIGTAETGRVGSSRAGSRRVSGGSLPVAGVATSHGVSSSRWGKAPLLLAVQPASHAGMCVTCPLQASVV
jgi:hypothetical protein